jgi:hypothetical protein
MFFGFAKQTEKQPKQIEFRFVSVQTEKKIRLFRGHPNPKYANYLCKHSSAMIWNAAEFSSSSSGFAQGFYET